jgi:hypothetical protein
MTKVFLVEDEDVTFGGTFIHVYSPTNGTSTDGHSKVKSEVCIVIPTRAYKDKDMLKLEDWTAPLTLANTKILLPIEFLMEVKG